jgi:predicted PurR-regulated permease PerM
MPTDRGPPESSLTLLRQLAPIVAAIAAAWLLIAVAPVLAPFAAAAVLAYICNPLVERMEAAGIRRTLASLLTTMLLVLACAGTLLLVVPLFVEQLAGLAERLPQFVDYLREAVLPWISEWSGGALPLTADGLAALAREHAATLRSAAGALLGGLSEHGASALGVLAMLLLVPVVTCYLLIDWPRLSFAVLALVPARWSAPVNGIAAEIDGVLGQFLRGQLSVMLVLALFYSAALALAGIDHALALGFLTGLLSFIPYLGFGLGLALALLAAFLQDQGVQPFVWVATIYLAGQLIESLVLTPRLIGGRVGLHPVAVILGLLVFGELLGFFGVIVALPVCAVLLVALRHGLAAYRASEFFRRP